MKVRTVLDALCVYHDYDGDLRGWSIHARGGPQVECPACRGEGRFEEDEIEDLLKREKEYVASCSRQVTVGPSLIKIMPNGRSTDRSSYHKVLLLSNNWPTDEEILEACGPHPFGGHIEKVEERVAEVTCYLD